MKVEISRELCSGHGRCYTVAPTVYEADDAGFNARLGEIVEIPPGREDAAREGVANCPEGAITEIAE